MARLIVEQSFDSPLSDEEYDRVSNQIDPCLAKYGARWMRSYFADDRRRMICEFEAADAEAVLASYRAANVAFDRIWSAQMYEPKAAAAS